MKIQQKLYVMLSALALAMMLLPAHANPPNSGWNLVFSDEFDWFNADAWGYAQWVNGLPTAGNASFPPQDISLHTGTGGDYLVLGTKPNGYTYGSNGAWVWHPAQIGVVWSHQMFTYGYVEDQQAINDYPGMHPTFWMLDGAGNWPPEIDVAEFVASNPNTKQTQSQMRQNLLGTDSKWTYSAPLLQPFTYTGWMKWGVDWEPNYIAYYQNGNVRAAFTGSTVPNRAMYVILTGGLDNVVGTSYPQNYLVDYVHWYQNPANSAKGNIGDSGAYRLNIRSSCGLVINNNWSANNGSKLILNEPDGTATENWHVNTDSSGNRTLKNEADTGFLSYQITSSGTFAVQNDLWGSSDVAPNASEKWTLKSVGGPWFQIINKQNGGALDSKVGTSLNPKAANGDLIYLATPDASNKNQWWEFINPYYQQPSYPSQ